MSHDHGHGPTPERALWVAVLLNGAFLFLEASVGWWTNSLALLSDAGHMVSDVGALIIALVALRIRNKQPSSQYTFGLRRAPVLGGLLNAASLVVIVVLIGIEAVERFQNPPVVGASAVLWTGLAGLVVNLGSAWYLARSRDKSVNTRGAMMHLLSDALGSVAAIVSGVAILLWDFPLADPIVSVVIGALILLGSWPLLRDTVHIILQRAPTTIDLGLVRHAMSEDERVQSVDDLHVWELDSGASVMTAIVVVAEGDLETANRVADDLREVLAERFGLEHITIECRGRTSGVCPQRY